MLNDLRFAFRMIASRLGFSATVIVTLALGIGVNTTVFTLVDAVLFKPVPIPGGERLVEVTERDPKNPKDVRDVAPARFNGFRAENRTFSGLEAVDTQQAIISESGNPADRYAMSGISTGLFRMLHAWPVMGRGFSAADGLPGAAPVVLIGYSVWQGRYGSAADIVGRPVHVNGAPATIVGVMPEGFRFFNNQDLWMPLAPAKLGSERTDRRLRLFGFLSPGTDIDAAQKDLNQISDRMAKAFPATDKDVVPLVQTFHQAMNGGPIKLIFLLMLGAVGFVLLITCANVANLMLSRALARSREIAVRTALGASRWQIIRQLLTESVLLSMLGGGFGLLLAQFGIRAFDLATQDVGKPYWILFTMNWRAFGYCAAISLATGLAFGIVPAWRASCADLNTALKDGTVGGTGRDGRLAGALVVFQFALTVVLLAGAAVMARSFLEAQRMNPFVPASHLLTARVSLPDGKGERYESVEARRRMHGKVLEALGALPGVEQAVVASDLPGLGSQTRSIEVEGRPNPDPKKPPEAAAVFASPNYLSAIGLPILTGRALNAIDGGEGSEASVVTRAFASRFWPGESPLGKRFRFVTDQKPAAWNTVVGVCGDVQQDSRNRNPPPLAYFSDRQEPWAWMGIILRTSGDPSALAASVRAVLQKIDPDLPLFDVRTLTQAIDRENWALSVFGMLFLLFAVIALFIASVGIYAVVAQTTSRRTREIGIRMALGASAGRVVLMVLSRGLIQLAVGLALGLGGAIAATRLMDGFPGVTSTNDPIIFILVVAVLLAVGAFACWLPARRAAGIAPTEALRTE